MLLMILMMMMMMVDDHHTSLITMLSLQVHDDGHEAAVREHAGTLRTQLAGPASGISATQLGEVRAAGDIVFEGQLPCIGIALS